jgi:hypothetical protein
MTPHLCPDMMKMVREALLSIEACRTARFKAEFGRRAALQFAGLTGY